MGLVGIPDTRAIMVAPSPSPCIWACLVSHVGAYTPPDSCIAPRLEGTCLAPPIRPGAHVRVRVREWVNGPRVRAGPRRVEILEF